jgi:CO dehydrogenase/acetyl-CoA synthase alpha subunit
MTRKKRKYSSKKTLNVFEGLLEFIYTRKAPNLETFPEKLLNASHEYGVQDWPQVLKESLKFTEKYKTKKIKNKILNYIETNYEQLAESKDVDWEKFVFENKELALEFSDKIIEKTKKKNTNDSDLVSINSFDSN